MKIRSARPEDLSEIVSWQAAMALETEGLDLSRSVLEAGCRAVLADKSKGHYWIVEEEGRALGMCLTLPEWSDWRNGTVLWIHSVYTLPEARGRGVFRTLYEYLQQMVTYSPDLKGLRLYVDKRNVAAQSVYSSLGMSAEHYDLFEWLKP